MRWFVLVLLVHAALGAWTPLMRAALEPGDDAVKAELSGGSTDVDARSTDGLTALQLAARACNMDAVRALLDWARMRADRAWALAQPPI